jgi:CAAX prenyl protease-like protein
VSALASVRLSPAAARFAPFALFIALLALETLVGDRLGDRRWLTMVRPLLVAGLLACLWGHYEELHERPRVRPSDWFVAIVLGFAVFAAWLTFDHGWAALGDPARGFVPLDREGRLDASMVLLRFAGFVLVVPVMEELFWRSFVLRCIKSRDFLRLPPHAAGLGAFALSSALFATEHSLWFAGLLAGMAYNACFMRSGNLWVSILSHAITNGTLALWILATQNWRYW